MHSNVSNRALFRLLFLRVRGWRGMSSIKRSNQEEEKKTRNACVWKSSFTRITGHQIVFLSDCKDVVVSCVIIEPTYNHEREGRGNFVQEGKSGELASPPSLTQQTQGWCGWPPVMFTASSRVKNQSNTYLYRTVHRSSLAVFVIQSFL